MLYFSASQELQFLKLLLRSYVRPFICCSSQLQVCVALQFFASGTFQINCGDEINVSQASTSRYIRDVSLGLQAIYQGFPTYGPPTFNITAKTKWILFIDEYYMVPSFKSWFYPDTLRIYMKFHACCHLKNMLIFSTSLYDFQKYQNYTYMPLSFIRELL